jgi:protein-S-isoprenylcysteine O-methyltransferase Ste14
MRTRPHPLPENVTPLPRPQAKRIAAPVRWRPDWWQRRHLAALALAVLAPALLRWLTPQLGPRNSALGVVLMIVGALVGAAGAILYVWFVRTHLRALRPDEAAQDPPPALLGDDVFAYTRNPHWLAVMGLVIAQAVWIDCTPLLIYAALLPVGLHFWVVMREEPHQHANLSAAFDEYAMRVPRWLPWHDIARFLREMWHAVRRIAGRD